MSVLLSAASCLAWVTRSTGARDEAALLDEIEAADRPSDTLLFLPYLSGERTPHNDVDIRAGFAGISHETDETVLTHAVLDGVAFALKDCLEALSVAGTRVDRLLAVGGGSRSRVWLEIIASLLNVPVDVPVDGDFGASLGAARLGQSAALGTTDGIFTSPQIRDSIDPVPSLSETYAEAYGRWRNLYPAIKQAGF